MGHHWRAIVVTDTHSLFSAGGLLRGGFDKRTPRKKKYGSKYF
jgi:hypothetical protein